MAVAMPDFLFFGGMILVFVQYQLASYKGAVAVLRVLDQLAVNLAKQFLD